MHVVHSGDEFSKKTLPAKNAFGIMNMSQGETLSQDDARMTLDNPGRGKPARRLVTRKRMQPGRLKDNFRIEEYFNRM